MPCACKVPVAQYPETAEWGPIAWDILHGLAERAGRQNNTLIQKDEIQHWIQLIESVEKMIPCDICRGHYKEYLLEKPVRTLNDMTYVGLREFVREWFWYLHNEVNEGNDKPLFAYGDLSGRYTSVPIKMRLDQLSAPIQRAMTLNGVRLLHWKAFEREVKTLLGML